MSGSEGEVCLGCLFGGDADMVVTAVDTGEGVFGGFVHFAGAVLDGLCRVTDGRITLRGVEVAFAAERGAVVVKSGW
jgi:hypothetical protein